MRKFVPSDIYYVDVIENERRKEKRREELRKFVPSDIYHVDVIENERREEKRKEEKTREEEVCSF